MARPISASVSYNPGDLKQKIDRIPDYINRDIATIFDYYSAWGTTWMKLNAPWTDDTGAARASLIAVAASQNSVHEMTLSYGVSYGIWLEVANSGRFQVLGPAMRIIGANIMKSLQGMLDGNPPNIGAPTRELPPVARKTIKPNYNKSGSRRSRKAYGQRRRKQA